MLQITIQNLEDTRDFAVKLSQMIEVPQFIALNGTLGAGKTQFVRYFASGLAIDPEQVTSPTYVLLQRYEGMYRLYHFDFYRLASAEEVWDLGFDEIIEEPAVVIVEWADKFPQCMPRDLLDIHIQIGEKSGEACRYATINGVGPRSQALLKRISNSFAEKRRDLPLGDG